MSARLIFLITMFILCSVGCVASILRSQYDENRDYETSQVGFMFLAIVTAVGAMAMVGGLAVTLW